MPFVDACRLRLLTHCPVLVNNAWPSLCWPVYIEFSCSGTSLWFFKQVEASTGHLTGARLLLSVWLLLPLYVQGPRLSPHPLCPSPCSASALRAYPLTILPLPGMKNKIPWRDKNNEEKELNRRIINVPKQRDNQKEITFGCGYLLSVLPLLLIPWAQIINSPRTGICHSVYCLLLSLQILHGFWTTVGIQTSADKWMNSWVMSSWGAPVVKSSSCESGKLLIKSWNDPHIDLNQNG